MGRAESELPWSLLQDVSTRYYGFNPSVQCAVYGKCRVLWKSAVLFLENLVFFCRWNSQHQCMKSVLKSEGAIRQVLASGLFDHLKSLVGCTLIFFCQECIGLDLSLLTFYVGWSEVWSAAADSPEEGCHGAGALLPGHSTAQSRQLLHL